MVDSRDVSAASFDLICTLPLSADLITLATHPTKPLLVAGFASGFVQAYWLPQDKPESADANATKNNNRLEPNGAKSDSNRVKFSPKINYAPQKSSKSKSEPRRSSLASTISSPPPEGQALIDTAWRTRRHKGSCRALAFSTDGTTIFSAGTDGIIKAADSETGIVVGKCLVPSGRPTIHPSQLLALNPTSLILGDDEGGVHEYTLKQTAVNKNLGGPRHVPTQSQPHKTHHPHRTEGREKATDPITSLTALPASGASTSKISRSWISTAGSTLAVCDIFKGIVKCSEEQGVENKPLELLSCAYLSYPAKAQGKATKRRETNPQKGKKLNTNDDEEVIVFVGDSSGGCSSWPRGKWENRTGHTNIRRNIKIPGLPSEDFGVECMAVAPPCAGDAEPLIVAGLAIGKIHFLRLDPQGRLRTLYSEYPHDDQGLDGCNAIAFDVQGRMITGGGSMVKIWRRKFQTSEVDVLADMDVDEEAADTPDPSDDGSEDDVHANGVAHSSDEASEADEEESSEDELSQPVQRKRKNKVNSKKRRRGKANDDGRGDHGILRVKGLR